MKKLIIAAVALFVLSTQATQGVNASPPPGFQCWRKCIKAGGTPEYCAELCGLDL